MEQIVSTLKKQMVIDNIVVACFAIFFILMNAISFLFFFEIKPELVRAFCGFFMFIYLMNLIVLGNFVRMSFSFTKLLHLNNCKIMSLILVVIFLTLISLTRYLCLDELMYFIFWEEVKL